jgi:hypothetical protein
MRFYLFLADLIVLLHFAYVAFLILGMAAILLGLALRWRWVRNFWFRSIHFLMVAIVVLESLCGILCPLTKWEDRLRELGGQTTEPGTFIGRWMDTLMFVEPSAMTSSVLHSCYCLFGAAVLLTMYFAPPKWPWKKIS